MRERKRRKEKEDLEVIIATKVAVVVALHHLLLHLAVVHQRRSQVKLPLIEVMIKYQEIIHLEVKRKEVEAEGRKIDI